MASDKPIRIRTRIAFAVAIEFAWAAGYWAGLEKEKPTNKTGARKSALRLRQRHITMKTKPNNPHTDANTNTHGRWTGLATQTGPQAAN